MKNKELSRLLQHPSLQMEDFVLKGALLFKPPLKHVLRGFCFESSGLDRSAFYVNAFVMPLCVPTSHLDLSFGHRIPYLEGRTRWNTEMPNLGDELGAALKNGVATFLSKMELLSDIVRYAGGQPTTLRTLEKAGYALARQGDAARAIEVFDRLLNHAELGQTDIVIPWHGELTERVGNLKDMLAESPEKAFAELAASEGETVRNLRLDQFREV